MAKKTYIGVGDKAKKVKKIYVGVDGKARRVKKAYVGVNGVAKLVYTAECVWGAATYAWNSSNSSCTATRQCVDCGITETANATISSAVKTAATCTTKGTTRYTAAFSVSWAATQTKDVQNIAATGHAPSSSCTWDTNHTKATVKCTKCSQTWSSSTVSESTTTTATCSQARIYKHTTTFSVNGTNKTFTCTTSHTGSKDASNHSSKTSYAAKSPTCTASGNYAYSYCSGCQKYYNSSGTETTWSNINRPATGHSPASSCTWDTNHTKATVKCNNCSQTWSSSSVSESTTTTATCTTARVYKHTTTFSVNGTNKTFTCSGGHTGSKNASNHSSKTSYSAVSPTCTASGNYAYSYCSGCKKYYNSSGTETTWSSINRPATGHTPGAAATCTSTQTCTVCGTQLAAKNPNNHTSITTLAAVAATCMATGLTEGKKCTACGTVTVAQQTVAKNASNHSGAGCTVVNATIAGVCKKWSKCGAPYDTSHNWQATSTSSVCRTCKDCGYKDTSHNYDPCECSKCDYVLHGTAKTYATVAATCTSAGQTGGTYCPDCSKQFTAPTVIPALNHPSTKTINYKAATCTTAGYSGDTYCNTCSSTIARGSTIPAPGHNWNPCECSNPGCNEVLHGTAVAYPEVAATCTSDGWTGGSYCSDCNEVFESRERVPALNHPSTKTINYVAADCTDNGYSGDTYCNTCKTIIAYGSIIPANGVHDWVGKDDYLAPTCTTAGHEENYYCGHCGTGKTGATIPKLGHNYNPCVCTRCGDTNHNWDPCECSNPGCDEVLHGRAIAYPEVAATCTTDGWTGGSYCADCSEDLEPRKRVPAPGHDWDSYPYYDPCKCSTCGVVIHSWEDCTCADCGDHDDSWIDEDCYCSGCYEYFHQCTRYPCICEHCGWEDHTYGNSGDCIYGCGSHDDSYENTDPDECLIASTPILMADGTEKAISEVRAGDMVKSWDLDNNEYIDVKVLGAYCTGRATDWTVHTFDNGQSVTVYNNHRIFCKENNGVKGSEEWRAGLTALAVDGVETKYEDVEARHDETTSQRYTMLTENNLYFANGILCGHHSKSKYKFFTKGWLKATPEDIAHYATTAGIYEDMEKAFTNEEYLKQAAPLREQLLKAKEAIRVHRHEIKKIDHDVKKRGRNRIAQKELFELDDRRNGRIVEARRMKADSKSLRRELDELKTKFGITTKSKYQIWKETYDIDMEYLKSKR